MAGRALVARDALALAAALGAVLGHCFPVWLKFKGGKGVATALGVCLGLAWPIGAVYAAVWLGMLAITRISSLAGMSAVVAAPVAAGLLGIWIWCRAARDRADRLSAPREFRAAARRTEPKIGAQGMNAPATLAQDEAFARIRLLRSPNIGPISYAQLLRRFGNAQAAIEALPDLASRGGRDYRPAPRERIEDEVAAVRAAGARYLFHDMPGYPEAARPDRRRAADPDFSRRSAAGGEAVRRDGRGAQCLGGGGQAVARFRPRAGGRRASSSSRASRAASTAPRTKARCPRRSA